MNRMVSRLCACLVAFSLFAALCGGMVARAADGFDYNYTYTYDYWGDERQSPDAYRTSAMLSSVSLGLETPMRTPRGLTVSGNDIYIVDTGNNRILQVARDGESFTLTRVISEISGDITPNTLSAPQDVFVMADGTLFIADTNNNRILKADRNLNLLSVFTRPTDATFDQSMAFLPTKLVCDTTGRVFCLAQNVNRGLMKYEADGTFTGFIGASEVHMVRAGVAAALHEGAARAAGILRSDGIQQHCAGFGRLLLRHHADLQFQRADLRRGETRPPPECHRHEHPD